MANGSSAAPTRTARWALCPDCNLLAEADKEIPSACDWCAWKERRRDLQRRTGHQRRARRTGFVLAGAVSVESLWYASCELGCDWAIGPSEPVWRCMETGNVAHPECFRRAQLDAARKELARSVAAATARREQESLQELVRWPVQFTQLGIILVQHLRAHGATVLWPSRGGEAAFEIVGGMENDPGARRALLNRLYECVMDVPMFLALAASDTIMEREFAVIQREASDPGVWVRETIEIGSKWRTQQ